MDYVMVNIENAEVRVNISEWKAFTEWRTNQIDVRNDIKRIFEKHGKNIDSFRKKDTSDEVVAAMKEVFEVYGYLGFSRLATLIGKSRCWVDHKFEMVKKIR